ncbi:hypothetical protein BU17DRAFT_92175 [Hysterangium stoloniferum]|nr:hypothetical protein BU17DRAFT_92175 [Hysterangium stoloniferum]
MSHILDGKTPYELLHHKKPNIGNLQVWSAQVWVHDANGSKLNMRVQEGHWGIGSPSMLKVEAIQFTLKTIKLLAVDQGGDNKDLTIPPEVNPDPPYPQLDESALTLRCLTCQCTESPYLWILHDGTGTHDGQTGNPVVPHGIQGVEVEGQCESSGDSMGIIADTTAGTWEMEDDDIAYAMHAETCETEALEPCTIDEAWKQSDWSQWDEAIKAELKSLDEACTCDVISRPAKNVNVVDCKWIFKIKKNQQVKSTSIMLNSL